MKTNIQAILFETIKMRLNSHNTFGHVISEILNISLDAVYRRFRGETSLTIQETKKLCSYFDISFDSLINAGNGEVIFQYPPLNTYDFSLESYLQDIVDSFKKIKQTTDPQLFLSVNNTHFFQLLNLPQLVRFRLYFWAKTHLQIKTYENELFKHEKTTARAFDLGKEILQMYNSIPSFEIIDPELMRGFLRQILYYFKAHMFEDPSYALFLCDRVLMFAEHLKEQAIIGKKFIYGTNAPFTGNDFQLYLNETINSDSNIFYSSKESTGVFITHNVMNYLHTTNKNYVSDTKQIIDKQLANSSLLSKTNEKERNNFFFEFEKTIRIFRNKIEADIDFS